MNDAPDQHEPLSTAEPTPRADPQPIWATACAAIAGSGRFQSAIIGVILIASALVGLETYPAIVEARGGLLGTLDTVILAIFTIEIVIRLAAYGTRPWRFFTDPWNVFDFTIVVLCLVPIGAEHAAVARLVRLLRVFRLFSGLPRLRLIVGAMLHAIPSIFYVALLLFLLFYVYGIVGVSLFSRNDPVHFGDLHTAMLSLLRTVTLEDWTDLMYTQIYGSEVYGYDSAAEKLTPEQRAAREPKAMPIVGTVYFVSFVLIGTMIVLNLFIGVMLSSLSEAQATQAKSVIDARNTRESLDEQLESLESRLDEVKDHIRTLRDGIKTG